jgi:hypothetical protein
MTSRSPHLEVVRGRAVASARHVTGGHVSEAGQASLRSTPELWVATPDGSERRLVGDALAEARPGHDVAVVLQERQGGGQRWQEPVLLANLSTATTWLDPRANPGRAWGCGAGDVLVRALVIVPLAALPFLFVFLMVSFSVLDPFLSRAAEDAAFVPVLKLGLLLLPLLGLWLSRELGRWDLRRRTALLAVLEAALAGAGVDTGQGREPGHEPVGGLASRPRATAETSHGRG